MSGDLCYSEKTPARLDFLAKSVFTYIFLSYSGGTHFNLQNVSRKKRSSENFFFFFFFFEDRFLPETFYKKLKSVPPLCVTSSKCRALFRVENLHLSTFFFLDPQ